MALPRGWNGADGGGEPVASEIPRTETHHGAPKRTMTWWQLTAFGYVALGGGPFGMESAVQAGGSLMALCGIIVFSLLWATPQAIMTAELSTAYPVNGGMVVVRVSSAVVVASFRH